MNNRVRLQPLFNMHQHKIIGYEALYSRENEQCKFPSATAMLSSIASVEIASNFKKPSQPVQLNNEEFMYFINMTNDDAVNPNFAKRFLNLLSRIKIDPKKIILEVSETTALNELDKIKENLEFLCLNGVQIALDDFGTNFSTLELLSRLPLDIVKINMPFVQDAPIHKESRDLLKLCVEVSHDIGCSVVAEGIETNDHMDCAMEAGADIGQGFIFTPASFASKIGIKMMNYGVNNPFIPLRDFGQYLALITTPVAATAHGTRSVA